MPRPLRIHPSIGVARVGNSEEFFLAPESMAGFPDEATGLAGGMPIRAGTESDPITSSDLRDNSGALKRQAARFRIFVYDDDAGKYPSGNGRELNIGDELDGKKVRGIVWTVHLANKKANTFVLVEDPSPPGADPPVVPGIGGFVPPLLPPIRNAGITVRGAAQPSNEDKIAVLNSDDRVRRLTIDPGPRTISGSGSGPVRFDRDTVASVSLGGLAKEIANYPKLFPDFDDMVTPSGPIDTLGELRTDDAGRLLVVGGYGRAVAWNIEGSAPLLDDVNNDQWFDDASDGPVSATVVFEDNTTATVAGAWVTATDPGFAPQIPNVVSLWDDVYDSWVRDMALDPKLYDAARGGFQRTYKPTFDNQIRPIFQAAALQQWTTNLNAHAMSAHARLASISATDDPHATSIAGLTIFRDPNQPDQSQNTELMPLALGDANESLLSLRETQYFFLQRWNDGLGEFLAGAGAPLGPGESLDKASLQNCLGGRFSPGIDMTFVLREPSLYQQDWRKTGAGPFRVLAKELSYEDVDRDRPFLTGGYVPRHVEEGLEPGDLSKWMAIPWHTDYNSCATHTPNPNPRGNKTLFWSWPAQRPVSVFPVGDVKIAGSDATLGAGDLQLIGTVEPTSDDPRSIFGRPRWSVRGPGTDSSSPQNWGRFQDVELILTHWSDIGTVLQDTAIDAPESPQTGSLFLEAESRLVDTGVTPVVPFPNVDDSVIDERDLFLRLMNMQLDADTIARAGEFATQALAWAERYSNDPKSPVDQQFFEYSEEALQERLDLIYQELVDQADFSDPATDPLFKTHADMITRIVQFAPLNLVDGSWLRNIGRQGPIDEVRALLFSVLMDELGDGNVFMNHCNIYMDLCHSVGFYPHALNTREFAYDARFLDSAFTVPTFELAISEDSERFFPELIGMTLNLEWQVVDLKPSRDLLDYFGMNSHFYVMHIGIDNAVNGHGQRAVEAVRTHLRNVRAAGGDEAVQQAWRRIWNGFVAFGNLGTLGQDLQDLIAKPPTLRRQVIDMIAAKAKYGSANHQQHQIGGTRINEWFADPAGFLDALAADGWLTPGDWEKSRLLALMDFETGPMFRVFTDDEIQLWADYTNSLGAQAPPAPAPEVPPGRAMALVIDQLRPIQHGVIGHDVNLMADADGVAHSVAWWFDQHVVDVMEALARSENGLVTPNNPAESQFIQELIAPTGPMGGIFGTPAKAPNTGSCRDVVVRWVEAGCPIPKPTSLRLNSLNRRDAHAATQVAGMGAVH